MVICLHFPLLTACWDQKELTDLAFVMMLGVDKGKTSRYEVSFSLVNPGNVSSAQTTSGGRGMPIAVYKSEGNTLTEAARNATKKVSRRLYYAHTTIVAVDEKIARSKRDLLDLLDALDRDPGFRKTTEILIIKGTKASEFVSAITILDKIPVNKVTKEIRTTQQMLGENYSVNIDDFISAVVTKGKEPMANGYKVRGKASKVGDASNVQKTTTEAYLQADGMAVFHEGKLVGWIDNEKARGVLWVLNKIKSTDINVTWKGKKDAIVYAPIRSTSKVTMSLDHKIPVFSVKISNEGWISEANTNIDLTDPSVISKIQHMAELEIKNEIKTSIKEAQKLKADVFGFGEKVHKADPILWKKVKNDWGSRFARIKVNVDVDCFIRKEGVRTSPFWTDMNK